MSVTSAQLAAQPNINQLCANCVGWHVDVPFPPVSPGDGVNAASIYPGAWLSDHVRINQEYAE